VYRLIDRSGESSEEYALEFLPGTEVWDRIQSEWKVYPNPARDHIIIESGTGFPHPQEFILFDITGKQVLHQQLTQSGNKIPVDLPRLDPGIYIYLLQSAGQRSHGKVEVVR
jgi:hypothetical protein